MLSVSSLYAALSALFCSAAKNLFPQHMLRLGLADDIVEALVTCGTSWNNGIGRFPIMSCSLEGSSLLGPSLWMPMHLYAGA